MMKKNFKKVLTAVTGLAVAVTMTGPSLALAQRPDDAGDRGQEAAQNARTAQCEALTRRAGAMLDRFEEARGRHADRIAERRMRLEERRTDRAERREELREGWLEKRADLYDRLDELAEDDEEKIAVNAFKQAVDLAVQERRDSMREANTAFQTGLQDLLLARDEMIAEAKDEMFAAMSTALEDATEACGNGDDPKEVREDLRQAFKDAREALKEARDEARGMKDRLRALVEERKEAHEEAGEAFKAALEDAKEALKETLGEDEDEEGEDDSATSTDETN